MSEKKILYVPADVEEAYRLHKANCGPAALAAILERPVEEVMSYFGPNWPGFTNPTRMLEAVKHACWDLRSDERRLGYATFPKVRAIDVRREPHPDERPWPAPGVALIQWGGSWTRPGVPVAAAYQHTHWVAAQHDAGGTLMVYDINAGDGKGGWLSRAEWARTIVPSLLDLHKGTDRTYWVRYSIQVRYQDIPQLKAPAVSWT